MDRYGLFRPTKSSNSKEDWSNRKTKTNLHLDMNPWHYVEEETPKKDEEIMEKLRYKAKIEFILENNHIGVLNPKYFKLHVQGLINLTDNKENDGGFQIVPGFKHWIKEWTEERKDLKERYGTRNTFIVLPSNDPIHKMSIRVTARAGSVIIWDQRTIHGSRANNSPNFRYAQFIKMFPSIPKGTERRKARSEKMKKLLEESEFVPSDFGNKVFGLEP